LPAFPYISYIFATLYCLISITGGISNTGNTGGISGIGGIISKTFLLSMILISKFLACL